ncbi:MAG: spore germination protein [Anaeroplasmataceae bacterium]
MKNIKKLIDSLSSSKDVVIKEDKSLNMIFIYQEQMCNMELFIKDYYILLNNYKELDDTLIGICQKSDDDIDKLYQLIFSGLLVIYNKNNNTYYKVDISKMPSRQTSDSTAEPEVMFGSRDGFVENYKDNIALIRNRVKSSKLVIDEITVGRRSKTIVSVLSIDDIHNEEQKKEIIKKIESLDIDACLEMSDVAVLFQEKRKTPAYLYIGSPNLAVRHLLDGQFLILIDRVPTLICLPVTFASYTKTKVDTINIGFYTVFERMFILISLFISTIFLGFFSSIITFQKTSMSLVIARSLAKTENGTILPVFFQILFVLILFELYGIIGLRSPKATLSSTIVLIGGIIIGQNTIESKIVGVTIMTLTALAFLAGYAITSNINLIMFISVSRGMLLLCSTIFGIYGLTLGLGVLLAIIYKEKTMGVSFLSPFIPFDIHDLHSFFVPASKDKLRPDFNIKNRFRKK